MSQTHLNRITYPNRYPNPASTSNNYIDQYLVKAYQHNELVDFVNTLEDRVTDLEDGDVAIDTITPASGTLAVTGDFTVSGTSEFTGNSEFIGNLQVDGQLACGVGNVTAPSIYFSEPDTGIYYVDTTHCAFSTDGVKVAGWDNTGLFTDVISENTSNTGVTIDSVLLKDGQVKPDSGTVTQATSITTGVTLDKPSGIITTVSATTAAVGSSTFTVTNSFATATSNIRAYIVDYAGTFSTDGIPVISVDNRTAGTFDIVISNAHNANALNGVLQIGFNIS